MLKFEWPEKFGIIMGPHLNLKLHGLWVGHFYIDADKQIDAEKLLEEMVNCYNKAHPVEE